MLVRNIIAWAYTKDETLTGYAVRVMRTPNYRWGGLMSNSSFLLLFVQTEKSFLSADTRSVTSLAGLLAHLGFPPIIGGPGNIVVC